MDITKRYTFYDIELVGKSHRPLETLVFSKSKDKIPKEQKSNVVYSIECQCKRKYVGQTSQYLQTRFRQHQRDGTNRTESISKSALSHHLSRTNHEIMFEKTAVLLQEDNKVKRDILEMIKIKSTHNTVNLKTDTALLPQVYDHLLFCH